MLPIDAGTVLLPIARGAIATALGQSATPVSEDAPWLHEPGACFVTLMRHGQLRGCIGSLEARRSLLADIKANAVAAAFQDPRFSPLSAQELDDTNVEVSVLSPPQALYFSNEADALSQLRPGVDGIVFICDQARSTFLPQVWEQLPDRGTFLAQLKRKAGFAVNFWSDGVHLQRYTVNKWCESDTAITGNEPQR